jgi:hypothetical protein
MSSVDDSINTRRSKKFDRALSLIAAFLVAVVTSWSRDIDPAAGTLSVLCPELFAI